VTFFRVLLVTSIWGICQRVTWKKLAGSVCFFFAFETLDSRKETGAWKKNIANLPQMLVKNGGESHGGAPPTKITNQANKSCHLTLGWPSHL